MGQPIKHSVVVHIGDWATDEDGKSRTVYQADRNERLAAAYLTADADTDDQDTNYNTFSLKNSGSTAMATLANGPAAGGVPIKNGTFGSVNGIFTLDTTLADRDVADGEWVELSSVKTGTGQAVPGMSLVLEFDRKD